MSENNFADIGRIEAIKRLYENTPYKPFAVSSFETSQSVYLTTQSRLFSEGVDFSLVYFPLKHLGYKCTVAVIGELFACLSHPKVLDVRLGVSSKLDFSHIQELWEGIVSAAKEFSVESVSLDLVPSKNGLNIAVSATGQTLMKIENSRPKPQSKDLICVSGNLGGAYLGMRLLEKERERFEKEGTQPDLEKYKMIVGEYLKPSLNPGVLDHFDETGILPSAGYLITRGLSDCIKQLVRDTGLGAKVYAQMVPFEGNSFALGKELEIDTFSAALNGGEDYRLLFTIPISKTEEFRRNFQTFDIIGHLALPDVGAVIVTPEGVELPLKAQGWMDE